MPEYEDGDTLIVASDGPDTDGDVQVRHYAETNEDHCYYVCAADLVRI